MTPQTGACGEVEDLSFTEAGEKESGKEGESLFCGIRAELPRASSPFPAQHGEEVLSGPQLRGWTWPQPQLDSGHVHSQVHRALSQLTVARKPKWGLWFKMAQ